MDVEGIEDNPPTEATTSQKMEEPVEQVSRKRRALLLRERVMVIEMYSTRPRPNYETLARMFNCGRSQIKNILRQKGKILQEYERNPQSDRVRRTVPAILLALNQMVDEWLKRALCHKMRVDEKMILQKSVQVQKFLDYEEFEPTKIWLRSFKRRHGYYRVDLRTIQVPEDKLKSLKLRDIFDDIKETLDPSVTCATELKLSSEQSSHGEFNSEQDEEAEVKDIEIGNWELSSDEFLSSDCNESVVLKDDSEALDYLKPLEEFAMLTDNFRAIGLISQLESIFRSKIRVSGETECKFESN